jgi:hypothetical protein
VTADDKSRVRSYESRRRTVTAKASSFWIELDHLREVVRQAEGMDGKAVVYVKGLSKSSVFVDEWNPRELIVRDEQTVR